MAKTILVFVIVLLAAPPVFAASIESTVSKFFNYGLTIGGTLAALALVWAGVEYVLAAGNPSKQGDAKDRALQAVVGLALLLSAVLVLRLLSGPGRGLTNVVIPQLPVKLEPMTPP